MSKWSASGAEVTEASACTIEALEESIELVRLIVFKRLWFLRRLGKRFIMWYKVEVNELPRKFLMKVTSLTLGPLEVFGPSGQASGP